MLRRIAGLAPGAELHAACAFAGDPVGIGATQAAVLDRLVRIDGDVALGRFGHHFQMVARHVLAFMPRVVALAIGAGDLGLAGVGHIPCLHRRHAHALVEVERIAHLFFVVGRVAGCLMMANQHDAL